MPPPPAAPARPSRRWPSCGRWWRLRAARAGSSAALREAQITPAALRRADARITAAQMETISGLAMQQLDDEALGWFSRRLALGQLRHACAARRSPRRSSASRCNAGAATTACSTEDIVLHLDADGAARGCGSRSGAIRRDARDLLRDAAALRARLRLLGDRLRASRRARCLPFAAPRHRDAYPVMFLGPVRFSRRTPPWCSTPPTWRCRCAATNAPCRPCCTRAAADGAAVPLRPPARAACARRCTPTWRAG